MDEQDVSKNDDSQAYEAPAVEERVGLDSGPLIGIITSGQ